VRVCGRDSLPLLQNLTTNDMSHLMGTSSIQLKSQTVLDYPDAHSPSYTGFLTKEGRLMFDAIVTPAPMPESTDTDTSSQAGFVVDVHEAAADDLIATSKHLSSGRRFRLSVWMTGTSGLLAVRIFLI